MKKKSKQSLAILELKKYYPQLPDNLNVGGWLDLSGTQITQLPDNLNVGGSLYLRGTQITQLPDNLNVGGSLDLSGTQITQLPDNLNVGGSLDLRGTQITQLPDNLNVGGSLYLRGTQIKLSTYWIISDEIGSRSDVSYYAIKEQFIVCGCFKGSLEEFERRVHSVYRTGNKHRIDYDLFISKVRASISKPILSEVSQYNSAGN
jgi:hypothetical protein